MVIDTSAIIAILTDAPERLRLIDALETSERNLLSAVTYYEALLVMRAKKGSQGAELVDELVADLGATIVSFDKSQAASAYLAYDEYGKGRSPARLNLGDCASFALAHLTGEPLLFKGSDFAATGVAAVSY
ncbi:MAG: type II toxin-antitoxin system VapC family toxin [Bryobacteraceae bacterium]